MGCGTIIVGLVVFGFLERSGAPWWAYAIVVMAAIMFSTSTPDDDEEEVDVDKIRAEIRQEVLKEIDGHQRVLTKWSAALTAREQAINQIERTADASELKPGSLRLIRNNLMKHHEGKRADVAYQDSATSKETTSILQALNKIIDQNKARAR